MISKKVELKLKRVKLIQSGQKEEARKVLREYWALDTKKEKVVKIVEPNKNIEKVPEDTVDDVEDVKQEIVVNKSKFNSIDDLVKIKGIGKETAKDIKKIYKTMSKLIKVLKSGENLPLRNDVQKKLKKELI